MHAGEEYGDIYMARGLCFKWRDTIGHTPESPVPAGRRLRPVDRPGAACARSRKNRFHYNWHWFWDTGNGDIGNQGIHEMDIARWGLGVTYPTKVSAIGGHFMFDDDQETPNMLNAAFEFDEERQEEDAGVRSAPLDDQSRSRDRRAHRRPTASATSSTARRATWRWTSYTSYKSWMGRNSNPGPAGNKGGDHYLNFIEAVRSRKRESLNAEIEEGATSTVLVHLANISYRVGRTLHFDEKTMTCKNDAEANKHAHAQLPRAVRGAATGVGDLKSADGFGP